MLNYVWLALIMLGIGVAITTDVFEKSENKYQNGNQLKLEIILQDSTKDFQQGKNSVLIKISKEKFNDFYKTKITSDVYQKAQITVDEKKQKALLFFKVEDSTPIFWKEMAKISGKEDDMTGEIIIGQKINSNTFSSKII